MLFFKVLFMVKIHILFAFFLFSICSLSAQQEKKNSSKDTPREMANPVKEPSFPGGQAALIKYLTDNMNYPAFTDKTDDPQSPIVMRFIVLEDGSISDIRILKEPAIGLGAEAARVIGGMPKWIPGQSEGKVVAMPVTLPLRLGLGVQKN